MRSTIFYLLIIFGSAGCKQKTIDADTPASALPEFSTTLERVGEKSFDLDSLTTYYTGSMQLYNDASGARYVCLLNTYNNTIYFYGYDNGKIHHTLPLKTEGVNKVGEIQSFVVKALDSVYVLSKNDFVLSLVNSGGKKIESHPLRFFTDGPTSRPMTLYKDKIFIGSYEVPGVDVFAPLENFATDNLMSIFDIRTKQLSSALSFPEIYKDGVWGLYLLQYHYTFNPQKEKFVISFAGDHSIYETDFTTKPVSHTAASSYFSEIPSNRDKKTDADSRLKYYLSTPSYQSVIYDPYQDLYYRIALQPISEEELMSGDPEKSGIKHASIIILNSDFKKIGETLLPRFSYTETMFFVSPDGLFLGNWEISRKDENKLVFTNFKPVTKSL